MPAGDQPRYRVDGIPRVYQQIQELRQIVKSQGMMASYISSLRTMLDALETAPLVWGDPQYRTQHQGGTVCQGICSPLVVHFAVYEPEKSVLVLDVDLLPWFKRDTNASDEA